MNVFRLSEDPEQAAKWHTDEHVNKMLVEAGQIMSHAMRENGYRWSILYEKSYSHHPLMDWCAEGKENFSYVRNLAGALYREKVYRWGGTHKTWVELVRRLPKEPDRFPDGGTPQYQAMPDEYTMADPVEAYRRYYIQEKVSDGSYDLAREVPPWI